MNRRGFTLIEVVVAIMVGAILLSISVNAFGSVRSRYAVREARNTFAALHARARAQAIEYGQTVEFHADAGGDSVWVERNDTTLEIIRLMNQFGVDMRISSNPVRVCFNSRGYADTRCSSSSSSVAIGFANGADSTRVAIFPLGQLVY